jgi:antitoxin component YwqK of YwqJK toxin-antitoxin module
MRTLLILVVLIIGTSLFAQEKPLQERFPNGRLKCTRFTVEGVDRFMTYYESGRVKETGTFRHGRREGVWEQYAENGALLARACFHDGHRSGTWEFRDARNELKGRLTYSEGRLAKSEQYDAAQGLVASRSY